jgi:hypothetical protein
MTARYMTARYMAARYIQSVAGGDLGAAAAARQLVQRILERQAHLSGVPTAGELLGRAAPAIDLHPEAVEAQGARTLPSLRLDPVCPEAIARLFGAAPCAERRAPRDLDERPHSGTPRRPPETL